MNMKVKERIGRLHSPELQDELITNVSTANPRTVVVFHGGGNFDSEQWINQVDGLVEAFYPGQLGGQALA